MKILHLNEWYLLKMLKLTMTEMMTTHHMTLKMMTILKMVTNLLLLVPMIMTKSDNKQAYVCNDNNHTDVDSATADDTPENESNINVADEKPLPSIPELKLLNSDAMC